MTRLALVVLCALLSSIDVRAAEITTRYHYDELGNMLTREDGEGHVTRWDYDDLNRVTSRTLPEGQFEKFEYDPVGNVSAYTDFNGRTIRYSYDAMDREQLRIYPDKSTVRSTYTPVGVLETITDKRGTTSFKYDARDRMVRAETPEGVIRYQFDPAGNRTLISTSAQQTTYAFDAVDRLERVTTRDGRATIYERDPAGNVSIVRYPNGTRIEYDFDARGLVAEVRHVKTEGNRLLARYHYTLYPNGQRAKVDEADAEGAARTVEYAYDGLRRLVREKVTQHRDAPSSYTVDIAYDKASNRSSLTRTDSSGVTTTTYAIDKNDRLLGETTVHVPAAAGVARPTVETTYSYEGAGNLRSKRVATGGQATVTLYGYDLDNRLIEVRAGPSEADTQLRSSYVYDASGSLIKRTGADGTATSYLVDTNRLFSEVLEATTTSSAGTAKAIYHHGHDLVSVSQNGHHYYLHADGLGSTRLVTDENGAIVDQVDYTAFGGVVARGGSSPVNHLFAGELYDPSTNLYYLRARWMDPSSGRFLTQDTFRGFPTAPVSLHQYMYANADPVNVIDPSGRFGMAEINVVLSVTGALASGYSIGSGFVHLSEGEYQSGFIDIGLGFMGAGVLTRAPFAISAASKMLARHRGAYVAMVEGMQTQIQALQAAGRSAREIAEWAVQRRNEIKQIIRSRMIREASTPTEQILATGALRYAELRNAVLYGNRLGPSVEWFVVRRKTYDAIVAGALRTSDDITRFFNTTGWGLLP